MTPDVFLTGATGFVGSAILARLAAENRSARIATRAAGQGRTTSAGFTPWDGLESPFELTRAMEGCSSVIHAAARVHVMRDSTSDSAAEFRRINVDGTMRLAQQAADAGVRRFVFLSSIKVNGEETPSGAAFTAADRPAPLDVYAQSKLDAEEGLHDLASRTGIEIAIVRPVLVYGPGVKANFLAMLQWVNRGVPLPLGAVRNCRSLVAVRNLADLIVTTAQHPHAANQVFLVSDGEDLSTPELLVRVARALDRPVRLLPIPVPLLTLGAALMGKRDFARRLTGSLRVDISKTRELLGWTPPVTVDASLVETATWFRAQAGRA